MERTGYSGRSARNPRHGVPHHVSETTCLVDHCTSESVPYAPISLCGRHMRIVYQFAADFISVHQADAVDAALATQ